MVGIAGDDIAHTEATDHIEQQQPDRAAPLNKNVAVELEIENRLRLFDGMDNNRRRFDEDAEIAIHVRDVENDSAGIDLHVFAEPTVQIMLLARKKPENLSTVAELFDLGMELAGVARAAGLEPRNDLVTHFKGLSGEIGGDVFAERNDFTGAFVTELNRAETEGIAFVLVNVSPANSASFDLDENFIISDRRNVHFMNNHLARLFQDGNFAFCGN